jgi:hypothetical protein
MALEDWLLAAARRIPHFRDLDELDAGFYPISTDG